MCARETRAFVRLTRKGEIVNEVQMSAFVAISPIVEPPEACPLLLGVSDRGQVLEVSELLLRQPRFLSHAHYVIGVESLHHACQRLLCPQVGAGVYEERLVANVLLDLLPRQPRIAITLFVNSIGDASD